MCLPGEEGVKMFSIFELFLCVSRLCFCGCLIEDM